MANKGEPKSWITVNGKHIPIYDKAGRSKKLSQEEFEDIKKTQNTAEKYNGRTITSIPRGIQPMGYANETYYFEVHPEAGQMGPKKYFKTEEEAKAYIDSQAPAKDPYEDDEHHATPLGKVKKGDFFKLSNKPNAKVYVRDDYDPSEKAYWIYDYYDVNSGRYMKKNKTVYTGFTF